MSYLSRKLQSLKASVDGDPGWLAYETEELLRMNDNGFTFWLHYKTREGKGMVDPDHTQLRWMTAVLLGVLYPGQHRGTDTGVWPDGVWYDDKANRWQIGGGNDFFLRRRSSGVYQVSCRYRWPGGRLAVMSMLEEHLHPFFEVSEPLKGLEGV